MLMRFKRWWRRLTGKPVRSHRMLTTEEWSEAIEKFALPELTRNYHSTSPFMKLFEVDGTDDDD